MNILFVSSRFPYPPLKGDQLIIYNRIRTLSKFHDIILITFYENEEEKSNIKEIEKFCKKIYSIHLNKLESVYNIIKGLFFCSTPMQINYYSSNRFREILSQILNMHKIDIIHVFLIRMFNYYKIMQGYPLILEAIDSMQLNLHRRLFYERGLKKFLLAEELKRVKKYEAMVGEQVKHLIVVAKKDGDSFNSPNVSIISNGVDKKEFYPSIDNLPTKPVVVFSGNMGYFPNIQAVKWFVTNCFSYIKEKEKNMVFYIVGGNVSKEINKLHNGKDIIVSGYVKSMGAELRKARVAIAPMQSGSGMQNKILEAMATGIPVVTTSLGLGDIQATHKKDILIANEAEKFSEYVLKCLENQDFVGKIVRNAFRLIDYNHSWESGAKKINKIYLDVINKS